MVRVSKFNNNSSKIIAFVGTISIKVRKNLHEKREYGKDIE